jgi:hypothetical protein
MQLRKLEHNFLESRRMYALVDKKTLAIDAMWF